MELVDTDILFVKRSLNKVHKINPLGQRLWPSIYFMYEIREWVSANFCTGIQHFTLHSEINVTYIGPISAALYKVPLINLF